MFFLLSVKSRIRRSEVDFIKKYGFSLEHVQPSTFEYEAPIAMVWLVVHDILINFYMSMWKFWTLLVRFFSRIADFINFEADDNNDGDVAIDDCDPEAETVSDNEFIDDETQVDENIEDYYAFTNVCRSAKDAMQDSFLELDSRESQVLNKSTSLEILLNKLRNLSIPFYVRTVCEIRILFTMQFSVPFAIKLKIRKMSTKMRNSQKRIIEIFTILYQS